MKRLISLFIIISLAGNYSLAQKKLGVYSLAFYNVENLFDTERDENINDGDFTPEGKYNWTPDKYEKKLDNIAFVLSRLAREHTAMGPAVIGLAEVENRKVLEDLVAREAIVQTGYKIVHYDSPDSRGIDVALLYNPRLFRVSSSCVFPYVHPEDPDFKTRDQLLVSGTMAGEPVHIIVNHWPSRHGSKSSELRETAAALTRQITDSIYLADRDAKIIIMGDMNDDPIDRSCRIVLNAKKRQEDVCKGGLFNTMWDFFEKGMGTLTYQGKWNLFDQVIISESLLGNNRSTLKFWKPEIFNRDFLIQQEGDYKGSPLRTFSGNTFLNGYSDHFPVLIYLIKEN